MKLQTLFVALLSFRTVISAAVLWRGICQECEQTLLLGAQNSEGKKTLDLMEKGSGPRAYHKGWALEVQEGYIPVRRAFPN
jgi:hypothetical protein